VLIVDQIVVIKVVDLKVEVIYIKAMKGHKVKIIGIITKMICYIVKVVAEVGHVVKRNIKVIV